MNGKVYFIGAGPGDPELLTVKAKRIIDTADVIIYADSLINPEICSGVRKEVKVYRSSSLTLEEITSIITNAAGNGKTVARLQSGDPAIYGAIYEQMSALDEKGIAYEIVPGVSSMFAAASALKSELTIPGLTQTVIVTRMSGRTPVPFGEELRGLAAHHCSLVIFLSTSLVEDVRAELLSGGYTPDTPVAVVYRASWPDELIIRTTLNDMANDVKKSGLTKQALIMVGSFLQSQESELRSKLYDGDFKHEYRR